MMPILLLGYNRPDFLSARIKEISLNKPTRLYIVIDGNSDREVRQKMTRVVENALENYFDPSSVFITQRSSNLGLAKNITQAVSEVLSDSPTVTVLEDDIQIGSNFLRNIHAGHELSLGDLKPATIGGFSGLPIHAFGRRFRNCWRTTKYFSAWGWSTDRETWGKYRLKIPSLNLELGLNDSLVWNTLAEHQKQIWINRFQRVAVNPNFTWDFQMQYMVFKYNLVNLLPLFRICENQGFNDSRSTNTKNLRPSWLGKYQIDDRSIEKYGSTVLSKILANSLDSITISGDSRIAKQASLIKNTLVGGK